MLTIRFNEKTFYLFKCYNKYVLVVNMNKKEKSVYKCIFGYYYLSNNINYFKFLQTVRYINFTNFKASILIYILQFFF